MSTRISLLITVFALSTPMILAQDSLDDSGIGACCLADSCFVVTEADCLLVLGIFQGVGTDCLTAPCLPIIPPGPDIWTTPPAEERGRDTIFCDFGLSPIPPGFFVEDGLGFNGLLPLQNDESFDPAASINIIIERKNPLDLPDVGSTGTVDIEIVALSLRSVDPITITDPDGCKTTWDVYVDLSDVPPLPGSMQVTKTHPNGGVYDSNLKVQPRFTFVRLSDPNDIRVWDTGLENRPAVDFQVSNVPWVHTPQPQLNLPETGNFFVPGVQEVGGGQQIVPIPLGSRDGWQMILVPSVHPEIPLPPQIQWDDLSCGITDPGTERSLADIDQDQDADQMDLLLLLEAMRAPLTYDPNWIAGGYDVRHQAEDLNRDDSVDIRDFAFMQLHITGPFRPYLSSTEGLGADGHPATGLNYFMGDFGLLINGRLQDPNHPDWAWHFFDYETPFSAVTHMPLNTPLPLGDSSAQAKLTNNGLTPDQITTLINLAGTSLEMVEIIKAEFDFGENLGGDITAIYNGQLQPQIDTSTLMIGGLSTTTVRFINNSTYTFYEWMSCPGCQVRIVNKPVCVCNGCDYTFDAIGWWGEGDYQWEVIDGAEHTEPDSGSGPSFTTTFISRSAQKNDIRIRVTYDGECTDEVTLTAVDLTVSMPNNEWPEIAFPKCDPTDPNNPNDPNDPNINHTSTRIIKPWDPPNTISVPNRHDVLLVQNPDDPTVGVPGLLFGGQGFLGMQAYFSGLRINTVPQCDECCESMKVGLIQNVTAVDQQGIYENGAKITTNFVDPNGNDLDYPILDQLTAGTNPQDPSQGPWYDPTDGVATGQKCDTPFDMLTDDVPRSVYPLCHGNPAKKLTRVEIRKQFSTYFVAECPADSGNFKCLYQWDWRIEWDADVTVPSCTGAPRPTVEHQRRCVARLYSGACKGDDFANAVLDGPPANSAAREVTDGF